MAHRILVPGALALLATAFVATAPLAAQERDLAPFLISDRAEEVALARSAAPAHVSDSAAVLVLTRQGYVKAAAGTNGFTCIVARSFAAAATDPVFGNPRVRAPHCFNAPAVRSVLPDMLRRAEWFMAGVAGPEIDERARRAHASGALPKPAPGAMAYMLSPRQHLSDEDPHWKPHVMFYYDRALPAAAWGAAGMEAPVIDGSGGDTRFPMIVLLIPVPQWSDGSPAPGPAHTGGTR
jgi:hypothetical protein